MFSLQQLYVDLIIFAAVTVIGVLFILCWYLNKGAVEKFTWCWVTGFYFGCADLNRIDLYALALPGGHRYPRKNLGGAWESSPEKPASSQWLLMFPASLFSHYNHFWASGSLNAWPPWRTSDTYRCAWRAREQSGLAGTQGVCGKWLSEGETVAGAGT